jgi:hypothetical protein
MNVEKLLKKIAFVDIQFRGIQTPRRDECASLKQNSFGT